MTWLKKLQEYPTKKWDACRHPIIFILFFFQNNRNLTLDTLLQRDEGLGGNHAWDGLQLIIEQVHELLVVTGIEFDEHGVRACSEVAFHNFRNVLQSLHHFLVHVATLQVQSHVCTSRVTQALRVDIESTTSDETSFHQMLNSLVNGCTRDTTLCRYVLERDAGIL